MIWPFGNLQKGRYGVIMADPPWHFKAYSREQSGVPQRAKEQHYKTENVRDLAALPVGSLALPDCALFMWSTSAHTPQALWLARQWGFRFSGKAFCWAKENRNGGWFMGMGHGTRRNTEDCWLFRRGAPRRVHKGIRELIVAPIRQHSRKPDAAYTGAQALFDGPYLELFSREFRAGWETWGNEEGKF